MTATESRRAIATASSSRSGGSRRPRTGRAPGLPGNDGGGGIGEGARARFWEPFRRLRAAGDRRGRGLGLALVAQQARGHAATVRVDASPAGGTRVVVAFGAA